jgi:hypothetical protein
MAKVTGLESLLGASTPHKDPAVKNLRRESSLSMAAYVTLLPFTIDYE